MTFDSPLLLFLAPLLGLALGLAAWLGRGRRIRLARRWSPALGAPGPRARRLGAARAGAGGRCCAMVALAGPRCGRTEIRTESRALSLVFAVDISRSMLAEDAAAQPLAARGTRGAAADPGSRGRPARAHRLRRAELHPRPAHGGRRRDPDVPRRARSRSGERRRHHSLRACWPRAASCSAPPPIRPTGCWWSSPTARRTTRCPMSCAQAEALKEAGDPPDHGRRGRARADAGFRCATRSGTLVEYKRDDEGNVIQTERRDDILRAMVDAAEGTLVPSEAPDQAGAVRDLVAAMKRSPTSATRTADLVPRALDPGARRGAAAARLHARAPGPGARRRSPGCCCSPRPARRPAADRRRAGARRRRSDPRRGRVPQGGGRRPAPRTRRSTTPAPRRCRRAVSTSREGALARGGEVARPRASLSGALQSRAGRRCSPRGPTPRGATSCWTTRPTACGRRCCCSRRRPAPSGISS